jgi:N-hydroxyarylamine O-acetyltransferase
MNTTHYLERIRFDAAVKANLETLRGLQIAHMQTVPFENLDIGLKRPLKIDEESLWEKLIVQKRGGFCYELNGLFAWLLQQLGFQVTYLNARVFDREGNMGIDFDHLALLVQIPGQPGRWLVDVGFGDSFMEPLNLDDRGEQAQGLRAYRIDQITGGFVVSQRNYDGSWERHYFFDLQPRTFPEEYKSACLFHQTSPESPFTRGSIITRATPTGRVSLEDGRLILTVNGRRTEQLLDSNDEYQILLKEYFDITLV